MAKIQSQSQKSITEARDFFVPSLAGGLLFLLLGSVLLLIYNLNQIISWVGNSYLGSADRLNLSINVLNNGFTSSFDTAFGGRLGQIIVWSLVGALAYILLWFLKNMLNSFENDVIVDHYLHPSNFSRTGYWGSAFAAKIFFGAVAIILITYTFLTVKVLLPAAAALSIAAAHNFKLPDSILYLLLCVLIPAITIYLWTLLVKTLAHLWKLL
jgi:hypothetical protein